MALSRARLTGGVAAVPPSEAGTARPFVARLAGAEGWIEPTAIADRFGLTLPALADTLGLGRDALARRERAAGPKIQQRMTEMLEIVALVRDWAGGEQAALSWYRSMPIPAFGGRTAEALVKSGQAGLVREYIDHMALGGFA